MFDAWVGYMNGAAMKSVSQLESMPA
jgi:hypothetical protein